MTPARLRELGNSLIATGIENYFPNYVAAGEELISYAALLESRVPSEATERHRIPACTVPPAGWRCTRERGHDGPCAALMDDIKDRLFEAQIGGCSCLAKTPEIQYHDRLCKFRLCVEAIERIEKLEAGIPPEPSGWQPIETAPDDELVIVFWRDADSEEHYEFDFKEEGSWERHNDNRDHYLAVGGPSLGPGPGEQAPYTHWKALGAPVTKDGDQS